MSKRVVVARRVERIGYLVSRWLHGASYAYLCRALSAHQKRAEDAVIKAAALESLAQQQYIQAKAVSKDARDNLKRVKKEVQEEGLWLG